MPRRRRFNPSKHPRDKRGRFRATYVRGSVERHTVIGRGGDYIGVKTGAEFRLPNGGGVLVKGIAGYRPRQRTTRA